jgi:broad specificity phosphatase PhoE
LGKDILIKKRVSELETMNRREFFIPTTAGAFASTQGALLLHNVQDFAQATRSMSGLTVLIIRHAEKPDRGWPGSGLTANGEEDKKSLVIRGWQRAGAWATLFGAGIDTSGTYPAPARIYAADPEDAEDGRPSQRPFETIKPLADRLKLTPITHWGCGDERKIAMDIRGFTGVVLICWEHKAIIADLLPALLAGQQIPDLPRKWDGERFDVVLRLDRTSAVDRWSFRQLFPQLLAGDRDTPVQLPL